MTHSAGVAQSKAVRVRPVQRAIALDSPLEWKQALSGIPHSFFHTWEHSYAMHLTHKLPAFLYCFEAEGVRIVCPFIERPFGEYVDIATPYGFSGFAGNGEFPDFPSYWEEFVQSRGYITAYVSLHPLFFRCAYTRAEATNKAKDLYFINTTLEPDELLQRCSESRRRAIRSWQASGIAVVTDRRALARFALENYQDFFRRKKANPAYNFSPASIQFLLNLDCVLAIGTMKGDKVEAVHITAYTSYIAEYLFYFGLPDAEQRSIGLIWEATRYLRDMGIGAFNLGGGLADGDSLSEFKRRFGAERRPFLALKEVVNAKIHTQLCLSTTADSKDQRDYFPAYRA